MPMSMISTLQKLSGIAQDIGHTSSSSINFNANLPVSIEVLRKVDPFRYSLKIGRKELTTKSHKELHEGQKYWANFSETKGGILTISNLWKQPDLFESDVFFLPNTFEELTSKNGFSYDAFKTFLVNHLADPATSQELFITYSYMLLALSKMIIHLPFLNNGKKLLIQFQHEMDEKLLFYIALEHLGPLRGLIHNNELFLEIMYEKSLMYLQKEQAKLGMITHLSLQKEISPLFDRSNVMLDIKG